ncbi:MAG TPA: hypothetical protein VEK83_01345 [Gemmatimonadales bacterium]|nr:hypothetical protein [Gemmatimonadales bacterium]
MPAPRIRLLGVGLYTRADASRLLKMTPSRVARWVRGYSYWLSHPARPERRDQPPVVRGRLPPVAGSVLISFLDLMELRVVKALVDVGLSLQHVRRVATLASDLFHTPYPFASRKIFTDGHEVFASLTRDSDDPILIEISHRHSQLIARPIIADYLTELDFDPQSSLARRWWPLGRQIPIVLDPTVSFGAPVVAGTATRTEVVAGLARALDVSAAANAFLVDKSAAIAAVEFESQLAAA